MINENPHIGSVGVPAFDCACSYCESYREKRKAKALIAAAPDLLDALHKIADGVERPGHVNYLSKQRMGEIARAAIDRTEGRT